jgi:hypothetical protein
LAISFPRTGFGSGEPKKNMTDLKCNYCGKKEPYFIQGLHPQAGPPTVEQIAENQGMSTYNGDRWVYFQQRVVLCKLCFERIEATALIAKIKKSSE